MPKVRLTFSVPDENDELNDALNGTEWRNAIQEIEQTLRARIKYESNKEWDEDTVIAIRDMIYETLKNRELVLY